MLRFEEMKEEVIKEDMFTGLKISRDEYVAKSSFILDH